MKTLLTILVAELAYFGFTIGALFWWRGLGLFDAAKGSAVISTLGALLMLLVLLGGWVVWWAVHELMDD